ncbi:MAG: UDP-3-O-(3-hydroxymyristoyl)glucosamine N-acyltransferase [Cetobacterium sp.]|uniref:UDP-3-O-(3-hydroxymyristoyl)glucosamine N-acyltransferase n=1 Tax=unclassified Cetobacterium TaxID=2630983 RepID=UPI00163B6C47|nr:UDP-3-O-(3-hydroxymyristoyl)glucosamine N-acyltransferase [Cetobacterium sp. 2A]MBC2856587.1 UDP-3-O-(3-hydroxymyristoyl)glucosamine N-acyltransferase [Cetobacterium sp. 2A]
MAYKISDLANLLGCQVKGDLSLEVSGLAPFFQAQEDSLTFASDEKFLKKLNETKAKVVLVPNIDLPELGKTYLIVTENPRVLMPKLLNFFKKKVKKMEKMREDSAKIGDNVEIAPNVYIGHDVIIGDNVKIYPNSTIFEGAIIGEGTIIYSNVTIREFCQIGKRCVIQPGAVIGSDGFGFVKVNGNNTKIDQIGGVILEDEVEIGANTTIDRGAIGDTIIKKYTKIDNLVQIAHNDIIGENCLLISQVGIAGSVEVGNNTTLAGQVGVAGHLKIGSNVIVAAKSGIIGNIADNQILSGYPLVDHKEDLKIKASMKKLPELLKRVKDIEKKIGDK